MSLFSTVATRYIAMWIKHNKYQKRLARTENVNEFKKVIAEIIFGKEKPDKRFIRGARIVSWDSLFHAVRNSQQL